MKTIFYTVLFLLVCIQTVYSQDKNLYSFITVDTNYFTTEQETRWNRIHSNDMYESFYFIEMTDFVRNNEYDGVLNTPLPDSSFLTYNFKYVTDRPEQLVWYGEFQTLVDTVASWGDLLYIDDESGKFGTFSNEFMTYELIDLSGDLQVLAVIDTSINYGECEMSDSESFNNQLLSSRDPEPCPIRVLATLYSRSSK